METMRGYYAALVEVGDKSPATCCLVCSGGREGGYSTPVAENMCVFGSSQRGP